MVRRLRRGDEVKLAIAYTTKERIEKTERTIEPLLQPENFDLWWLDGSTTVVAQNLPGKYPSYIHYHPVTGGSCRAIVYALTTLLQAEENYTHVGIVENDILLEHDWFQRTMMLFSQGEEDGLDVGAVSARTFEDRLLIQRDGYGIMHNIGAGCQILTRRAAELILQQYRTGMTGENRKVFSMLSGIDIAKFWAFRGHDHNVVADWTWDWMLAQHGMCSLALTPAKATHLEDLDKMGLRLVTEEMEDRRDQAAFERFQDALQAIRNDQFKLPMTPNALQYYDGVWTIFPHQIPMIGGTYYADWSLKWSLGYGCFAWKAGETSRFVHGIEFPPKVIISIYGSADILVSGGEQGGKVWIEDESGFSVEPELAPEAQRGTFSVAVPGFYSYRNVTVTALTPGVIFYGIRCREPQAVYPEVKFNFDRLPPL